MLATPRRPVAQWHTLKEIEGMLRTGTALLASSEKAQYG